MFRGDADRAQKNLRKAIKDQSVRKNVVVPLTSAPKRLIIVIVQIHGHQTQALLDSGAVPNLLSTDIRDRMGTEMKDSLKKLTVANGDVSGTVGSVTELRVGFDQFQVLLSFLAIDNPSFEVIIGLLTLKTLQAGIHLGTQTVTVRCDQEEIKLCLDYELSHNLRAEAGTDSKKFTTKNDLRKT